jgi:hypothetical protein
VFPQLRQIDVGKVSASFFISKFIIRLSSNHSLKHFCASNSLGGKDTHK